MTPALQVSAVFLISWSGLILTLSGIVKDIVSHDLPLKRRNGSGSSCPQQIIIGGSMLAFHTTITPMQFLGYS